MVACLSENIIYPQLWLQVFLFSPILIIQENMRDTLQHHPAHASIHSEKENLEIRKKKLQISTKVYCRLAQISTRVSCRLALCNIGCSMTRNKNKIVNRTKHKRAKIFIQRHQRCSLMKNPTVYIGAVQAVTARDSFFCEGVLHIQWTGHVPISVSKRMILELHQQWSDRSGPCLVFRWDGNRFTVCLWLFVYCSFFARPTGKPFESRTF